MFISELQYADGCVIVASSSTELQDALNIVDQAYTIFGMKINYGEPKYSKPMLCSMCILLMGKL